MPKGIYKKTKEHCLKIALANKGRCHSPATIFQKGHEVPKEWREKLSKSRIGISTKHLYTPEVRKKMSLAMRGNKNGLGNKSRIGYIATEEQRKKMSLLKIGHITSEETKEKIRSKAVGRKHTEEAKKRIGISSRKASIHKKYVFKNTSIEVKLQNLLKEHGIEFETHYPIFGRPDIFIKPNIAIFADGCYWHKCPECEEGNGVKRDEMVTRELQSQGYTVIRLWEHEINGSIQNCFNKLNIN